MRSHRSLVVCALLALIIASLFITGCATATQSAKRVCEIREQIRPDAVVVRAAIAARFDTFDPDTQAKLRRVDAYLLELDDLTALCETGGPGFDASAAIGKAVELGLKIAPLVSQLKERGVI
jgi:hypothetical protein